MKGIPGLWVCILLLFLSCRTSEKPDVLTIATAANMQYAMQELTAAFTEESGIDVQLVLGSSGTLTAQIMAGAPYDILVSADMQYPAYLYEQGLAYEKPAVYGYGQLVLWTCKPDLTPSLSGLREESIAHIAIANPELAPYGRAAREVLEQDSLYEPLATKLVYGESIAQTNQFIRTGAAEIGFTALSVVSSPDIKGIGKWILLPRETYSPIAQGILILNTEEKPPLNALKFYTFLKSETGRAILMKYGYLSANE